MVTRPADPALAKLLRRIREDVRASQQAVAFRANVSRPLISLVESGDRSPNDKILRVYLQLAEKGPDMHRRTLLAAAASTAGIALLPAEAAPDPVRLSHEWLVGDQPAWRHRTAGDRIGGTFITDLEQRMTDLRLADDTVPGTELLPVVNRDLAEAEAAAQHCSYTQATGQRLLGIIAELRQLAGWIAFNFADYARAETDYTRAARTAREAGDDLRFAWLISAIAYQKTMTAEPGDAADAVLLAHTALTGLPDATPKVAILLHERAALAAAATGDHDSALRALDVVADLHEAAPEPEPQWVYWLDRNESEIFAARCLTRIGRPHEAIPRLETAIAAYPETHVRELALYRCYFGEALAEAGEVEAAIDQYELALAADHDAVRLRQRLTGLRQRIAR